MIMKYESIADIFSANEKARSEMEEVVRGISSEEATASLDGEKWTIQQIVEHLSMVDAGISRICGKLLEDAKAAGKASNGTLDLSVDFREKLGQIGEVKVEAPERVRPTGNITIADAFERMKANRAAFEAMRSDFESYDLSEQKFLHPYFGEITATEWLVVAGGHEQRHTAQIERLLAKIRK